MNKSQKNLLNDWGLKYIEELGFIKQDETKNMLFIIYDLKEKRFALSIPKLELISDESMVSFNKEYNKKLMMVSLLNSNSDKNVNKHKLDHFCPRCKNNYSGYYALSRLDNETKICPYCGMEEAFNDFFKNKKSGI